MIRRLRGFTLLELLIALAMVGLITVLLFAGLRMGSNAWDRTEDSMDRSGSMRLVWQFLQNHLQQARTVLIQFEEEGNPQAVFSGMENGVEFVSHMTPSLGAGGVYVLRLDIVANGDKKSLRLSRWLYHPEVLQGVESLPGWQPLSAANIGNQREVDPALTAYYSESMLLDNIQSLEISYFGPVQDSEGDIDKTTASQWMAQWLQRKEIPWQLSIKIHDVKDQWPEMIITLPH